MYRYEMHCHSLLSGGGEAIERHVDHLSALGWAGMVITNHFFWGDNRVSRELPWNEFVRAYEQDWLTGKAYARSLDFDVIFGVEEHIGGGKEILIYGLEPDFFYANPVLREHRLEDYSRLVRAVGGVIVQAHPFRDRRYIPEVGPVADLSLVDGIEVFNAGNPPEQNAPAEALAAAHPEFLLTAGSDAHRAADGGWGGIAVPRRVRTAAELAAALKERICVPLKSDTPSAAV